MKKVKVFEDIWLENRLKVEERAILMQLYREMDNTLKTTIPSFKYLDSEAGISNAKAVINALQEKGILEIIRMQKGRFIEIKLKKGKTAKAPVLIWNLIDKWFRTILLTFYLKKGNNDFVWIDNAELSQLFNCSPRTISYHLTNMEKNGIISRERYGYKYKVYLTYLEV